MVLMFMGLLALASYPVMILADTLGHDHPAPVRPVPAERGMTADGVPWVAGTT